jgi:hypothetical protein
MKKNCTEKWQVFLLSGMLFALSGCKKDQEEKSFVDDYTPTLTENAGTSYNGDYFPIDIGYSWYWNGQATSQGNMAGWEIDPTTGSVAGYMDIYQLEEVTLPYGQYNVYHTYETESIERYFEKTTSAVNLRAMKNLDGSGDLIEIQNPCYIKQSLVVGDKWKAQPQIDQKLLETFVIAWIFPTYRLAVVFLLSGKKIFCGTVKLPKHYD